MTPEEMAFGLSVLTMASGIFTFTIRALLKSNCIGGSCCWGCVNFERAETHNAKELELSTNV